MVTVVDRTARILLKKQLVKAEEENKKQYELISILKLEPALLREFLQQTEKELNDIEKIIKNGMDEHSKEMVYHLIHSVKGNAALLNLTFISKKAHEIEETVVDIKSFKKFS